jgi:outer membrane protein insertion porin family
VTVKITEGKRYTFGEVRFTGRTIYSESELMKLLDPRPEGPFATSRVTVMDRNLQSLYKARGYFNAKVLPASDPKKAATDGRVGVTFHIEPGSLFYFGETRVTNEGGRLNPTFLPKRFRRLSGEVYDPEKLDEVFREMLRTGLFKNLRVNAVPRGESDIVDLVIEAEEAKAKEFGFSIGFGTYDGASAGVKVGDRNFAGTGRPLTLGTEYTQRGFSGELLYVDPWLLDTRFGLRARVYSASRTEEGYSKNEIGARMDITRRLGPHFELGAFVEQRSVEITDSTIDPLLIGPPSYTLTTVGITQSFDMRNDPVNPRRGFIFTSAFDVSLLESELAFTRATVRASYYLPIGERMMLAFGARAGLISPVIDSIPIDIRFFNGGGNTVRSFAERELGPHDKGGNPIGGEFNSVLNAEFTFPLVNALEGAVFFDAGNLTSRDEAGFGDMRYAIGLGLRYRLPIGPLRLDYGVNPSPRDEEAFGAFHFSFGFAF